MCGKSSRMCKGVRHANAGLLFEARMCWIIEWSGWLQKLKGYERECQEGCLRKHSNQGSMLRNMLRPVIVHRALIPALYGVTEAQGKGGLHTHGIGYSRYTHILIRVTCVDYTMTSDTWSSNSQLRWHSNDLRMMPTKCGTCTTSSIRISNTQ